MKTQVKERPIIFSGEIVRAILAGRKTQTRRVVKDQPEESGVAVTQDKHSPSIWHLHRRGGSPIDGHIAELKCPYEPGMRLWVRETVRRSSRRKDNGSVVRCIEYAADGELCDDQRVLEWTSGGGGHAPWRPSIHMPRWASRITLEVTDVRCERVQSISEEDALADGGWEYRNCPFHKSPVSSFAQLWDSINAKLGYSWDANPYVWAVSFKRLENSNV